MRGHYVVTDHSAAQFEAELDAFWRGAPFPASYSIAPSQHAPVVRLKD